MNKVKQIVVLVLGAALLLVGCKGNDLNTKATAANTVPVLESKGIKEPGEDYEEVNAAESLDTKGYTLAWEKDFTDYYEKGFRVSIYINAEKDDNGFLAQDDGQNWIAYTEIDGKIYNIFPDEFIQLGSLSANIYLDENGDPYILLTSLKTASHSLIEFKYTEGKLFKRVLVEKSNLNHIGDSEIR